MANRSAEQLLSAARLYVSKKSPYFHGPLLGLGYREATGTDVLEMEMTDRGVVRWNREFVERIGNPTMERVPGYLVHLLLHMFVKHPERATRMNVRTEDERAKWGVASCMSVNVLVRELGYTPPDGAVFPEHAKLPNGLPTEEIYRRLPNPPGQPGVGGKSGAGGGKKKGQEDGEGDGPGKRGVGKGGCGSCSGEQPGSGEPDEMDRTPNEMARLQRSLAEAMQQEAQKGRGNIPAELLRWANELLKPPVVPWRKKLGASLRHLMNFREGAMVHRHDRPSRRQAGVGYGPGKPVLPRPVAVTAKVAVVIDTSGSMGAAELSTCLSETAGILKAAGAEVLFMSCDAEVHAQKEIRKIAEARQLIKGGGGTSHLPVFAALDRLSGKKRPTIAICLTDGMSVFPPKPPEGMRVIWCLVGNYVQNPPEWPGCETIRVEEDGPADPNAS